MVTMYQANARSTSEDFSEPLVLPFRNTIIRKLLCEKSLKLLTILPARIIDKIHVNTQTGCWEWQGELRAGYGRCRWQGFRWSVHRLTFELVRGKIDRNPDHQHLMHMCENKRCCNPHHLKPGTNSENQKHYHKMKRKKNRES